MEPDEIAKERGLSKVTVEGHIIRCADEGEEVDWSRIIPAEYEQLIVDAIGEQGTEKLRPIKDALPEEVTYFAIHGVMSKYGFKAIKREIIYSIEDIGASSVKISGTIQD